MDFDWLSGHAVSAVAQSTNLNDVIIIGREDELHRSNVSSHCVNFCMPVPCVRNLKNGTKTLIKQIHRIIIRII